MNGAKAFLDTNVLLYKYGGDRQRATQHPDQRSIPCVPRVERGAGFRRRNRRLPLGDHTPKLLTPIHPGEILREEVAAIEPEREPARQVACRECRASQ